MQVAFNQLFMTKPGVPWLSEDAQRQPEDSARQSTHAPLRVVVVDDERDLANLAQALMSGHGVEVVAAYSAEEALSVLAGDSTINAVFSDIMMPGMNGLDLAKTVGQLYPGVEVVLTSGFTSLELLSKSTAKYHFVAKPYRIESVIQLLRSKLRS